MAAFEGALGTVCEAVNAVMTARPAKYILPMLKTPCLDARAFVVVRPPGHHCSEVRRNDQPVISVPHVCSGYTYGVWFC
jgi:acetoin utilization deacetylase AcuC-like enzyme